MIKETPKERYAAIKVAQAYALADYGEPVITTGLWLSEMCAIDRCDLCLIFETPCGCMHHDIETCMIVNNLRW